MNNFSRFIYVFLACNCIGYIASVTADEGNTISAEVASSEEG